MILGQDSEDDMTSRSYFGKMNSTLGSVVPLAMFGLKMTLPLLELFRKFIRFVRATGQYYTLVEQIIDFFINS